MCARAWPHAYVYISNACLCISILAPAVQRDGARLRTRTRRRVWVSGRCPGLAGPGATQFLQLAPAPAPMGGAALARTRTFLPGGLCWPGAGIRARFLHPPRHGNGPPEGCIVSPPIPLAWAYA